LTAPAAPAVALPGRPPRLPGAAPAGNGGAGGNGSGGTLHWFVRWLDALIGFIALEKTIILRNIRISSGGSLAKAFTTPLRLYAIIDAHVYLYWAINRTMPGTITYLDYNAAAFSLWTLFSAMTHKAVSPMLGAQFNLALNIRWVHLFMADFVWELAKVVLGLVLAYGQFILFPQRSVSPVSLVPDVPLLLAMFVLIGCIGSGFGLVLAGAKKRWPVIEAGVEAIMWFLFVTSGIYDSYVQLPPIVADYFRFNPVMVVIESGRAAFDRGYPVGDLSLTYAAVAALALMAVGLLLRRDRRGLLPQ